MPKKKIKDLTEKELRTVCRKQQKAYLSLKKIIEDKIKKINKRIDKMDKIKDEYEYMSANEDFKEEYNSHKAEVLALYSVLQKMEVLETIINLPGIDVSLTSEEVLEHEKDKD